MSVKNLKYHLKFTKDQDIEIMPPRLENDLTSRMQHYDIHHLSTVDREKLDIPND